MAEQVPEPVPGRASEPSAFRKLALTAALATAVFVVVVLARIGSDRDRLVFVDITAFLAPLAAVAACTWRAWREQGGLRRAWALLALGCASWAIGQAAWAAYVVVLHQDAAPFPGIADAGYLGLVPLAGAGLLAFLSGPGLRANRLRTLLDAAIIAGCLVFISWGAVIRDLVGASVASGFSFAEVVYLAYPTGDIVLATLAFLLLGRSPRGQRKTFALLGIGALSIAVADTVYVVQGLSGLFHDGTIVHAGWFVGFLLVGLAALRLTSATTIPTGVPTLAAAATPYWPFLLAAGAAIQSQREHGFLEPVLFWIALFVVFLMVARQFVILVENLQLRRQAERALDELRREKDVRARMTSAVTHDMLNAMSPVRLQLHLLRGGTYGPSTPKQANAFSVLGRNTERVARLAADLKDSASLEAGRLALRPVDVDLADLLRQAVEARRGEAQERNVALEVQAEGTLPVKADPERLAQVIDNLLSNALKFTPGGGWVTARARRAGAVCEIEISDSGRGLDAAEIPRLFQAFSQVHDLAKTKERGTGLGLYISRGILERHGGTLTVSSVGLGRGSTFHLGLPAVEQRAPA